MGKDPRRYEMKLRDPYMDKSIYKDPTICPTCGIVYHNKIWKNAPHLIEEFKNKKKEIHKKDCPACRKIKDGYALGIVEIEGDFIDSKKEEVHNRIKHVAGEEFIHNPLERIIKVENTENRIVIYTTTEHLAKKIGKSLSKAFKTKVDIVFSDSDKLTRVYVYKE
jgi:NMD protein affecting ribosome stability and mRNA decay